MPKKSQSKSAAASKSVASSNRERVFKTSIAAKLATKRGISDSDICKAVRDLMKGGPTKLPGGVYKKRINNNLDRSIVLCLDGSSNWFFVGLFQKNELDNITKDELREYQNLAVVLGGLTDQKIEVMIGGKQLMEICHEEGKCCEDGQGREIHPVREKAARGGGGRGKKG